jgi:hypothetical protein
LSNQRLGEFFVKEKRYPSNMGLGIALSPTLGFVDQKMCFGLKSKLQGRIHGSTSEDAFQGVFASF